MRLHTIAWLLPCLCCLLCSVVLARAVQAADLVDTDGDGLPDLWETQVYHTDPTKADTDGDGFRDRDEIVNGFDPLKKGNVAYKPGDYDKDGLNDRLELLFGSDPMNADTDGDSFKDGEEVTGAYSPTSTSTEQLPKSIRVVLSKQRLERQVDGITIDTFKVSTGKASTPTPVGTFKVLNKIPRAWSSMAHLWMPDWMAFTTRGHGIHELPEWPNGAKEGASHLGIPVSHGCIRLGIGPAQLLYDWTPVGTPVTVVRYDTAVVQKASK